METEDQAYQRIPGLYRLWDLPFVIDRRDDYQVHYVEPTEEGTPLFAIYRASRDGERVGQ
ncbi:hypothetical protein FIU85_01990 [Roseovarius sp. THAF8]|uniref:hypothetical protein n=1 Tax=Roseovarius sp. THAF8 TaxID=2587846 RepID=UPI0012693E77|nr:hypothetical protein [Roseovarius sp. THAF8]QFT96064.1 hypothetical protein FIU85_01990 [Roseovarius sp. THAF8]